MRNKKSMKLLLLLGFAVLSLALLPVKSWAPTDGDGDGFASNKDCNDSNPNVYPGATEICNSIDDDCDGLVDEDGVCEPACTDSDGDTYYAEAGCGTPQDCNDGDFYIHPGAEEVCGNGVDEDCDGSDLTGIDGDGDGYFAAAGCGTPADCDDGNSAIHPSAVEICGNGINENCVVEDAENFPNGDQACCTDSDGDGFSVAYAGSDCGTEDCNDSDADVHPGAVEICDGQDNQCPGDSGYGLTDEVCSACTDSDGDTYYAEAACGAAPDCDDSSTAIHPGATELNNGVDDNCDGQVDEGWITALDSDEDGIRDSVEQSGFVLNSEYTLWNGSGWDTSSTITIPGSSSCLPGQKCLSQNKRDLFIAWRPLEIDSRIDLTACNIFSFAASPISIGGADYTVWVTKERAFPAYATNRRIANDPADSGQFMAMLIEDAITSGTSTGISQPGTIMVEGMGKAWIKSHKIDLNIDTNCGAGPCLDEDGTPHYPPYIELKCVNKKKTAIHEVWHVLHALNTSDLHIDDWLYIMYGSVMFTEKGPKKTYHIGDQFSPAGLTDPSFQ